NLLQVTASRTGGVNSPRPRAPARPCGAAASAPRPAASGSAPGAPAAPRPRPRPRPPAGVSGTLIFGPSSLAHVVNGSGVATVALYFAAIAVGGPVKPGPAGSNLITGGVFLFA